MQNNLKLKQTINQSINQSMRKKKKKQKSVFTPASVRLCKNTIGENKGHQMRDSDRRRVKSLDKQ